MKATWNGTVLAKSDETIVVEGNHLPEPKEKAAQIKGYAAFWKGVSVE